MTGIRLFSYNSIRAKLFSLVIFIGGLQFLLVSLMLFGYGKLETRDHARRELSSQAELISSTAAAAIAFSDEKAATETLASLHADGSIVLAAIYTQDGRLFAGYGRAGGQGGRPPAGPPARGTRFEDGNLLLAQPIELGGQMIGTVFLKFSMTEANSRQARSMRTITLFLLLSLGVALLLSWRMQTSITTPLAHLSAVAHTVSATRDYSARAAKTADGEIGFLVDSFNQMLSQIELREHALQESEERYALAARGANDGLWDWKLSTNEIYLSPRWNQMLGYPETESRMDTDAWLSRVHHVDRGRVKAELVAHLKGETAELASEYRIRQKSDAFIWVLSRGIAVRDAAGRAVRMAGSQTDITKGKVADPLTGLPNRLYFLERLESALDAARRTGTTFAILFLDMDRFKLVNDSMGHAAGDALLEGVSDRLRESLHAATTAGDAQDSAFVARLGGDEFAILVDPVDDDAQASRVAERILGDLRRPFQIQGRQVFADLSIGIAMGSTAGVPEELLRNADTAMYQAKTAGKARFAVFDNAMREEAVARLEIETSLRKALERGELILHYQPQISVDGLQLTGLEALVRWNHPERGLIPPGEFIPVAEETGLIVPLGTWVLREACRQLKEWQSHYGIAAPLTVAVNVSFKQLTAPGFVDQVRAVLAETGIAPACLRLEMTESVVMTNPQESIATLCSLKELGLGLEIDDFGTGYSSLGYLSALPFDTVKIDRVFVSDLGIREESAEIVRTILELARSLHLDVVAEGVETELQLQTLSQLGCARAQGFYFARPVASEAIPAMLAVAALQHGFRRLEGRTGVACPASKPGERGVETAKSPEEKVAA